MREECLSSGWRGWCLEDFVDRNEVFFTLKFHHFRSNDFSDAWNFNDCVFNDLIMIDLIDVLLLFQMDLFEKFEPIHYHYNSVFKSRCSTNYSSRGWSSNTSLNVRSRIRSRCGRVVLRCSLENSSSRSRRGFKFNDLRFQSKLKFRNAKLRALRLRNITSRARPSSMTYWVVQISML